MHGHREHGLLIKNAKMIIKAAGGCGIMGKVMIRPAFWLKID